MTSENNPTAPNAKTIHQTLGKKLFGEGLLSEWLGTTQLYPKDLATACLQLAIDSMTFGKDSNDQWGATMACINLLTKALDKPEFQKDSPTFAQYERQLKDLIAQMAGAQPTSLN